MEKVPFCITCSLLVYMIQNHYKDTIAVARVVIVGAARIDNAEIVAVVVVRAAEPPPQWNTQTSFFKRTFPSRLQKTGICPFHRLFRQSIPGTVPGYGSCMNYPLFAFPSFSLPFSVFWFPFIVWLSVTFSSTVFSSCPVQFVY